MCASVGIINSVLDTVNKCLFKKKRKYSGSTQNKMVQLPGTGRCHKEMKQIAEIEMERLLEDKGCTLSANEPLTFPHFTL